MLMQNFGVTNKEHYGMLWYFWCAQLIIPWRTTRDLNWENKIYKLKSSILLKITTDVLLIESSHIFVFNPAKMVIYMVIYICVMIPRYLYVINDPPCNSAYAAKRLNKRSLLLLLLLLLLL